MSVKRSLTVNSLFTVALMIQAAAMADSSNTAAVAPITTKSIETGSGGNDWLEMSRGYGLTDVFSTDSIDTVNLFNGNVVLDIPLGQTFQVGRISYGLRAIYNSKNWDFIVRCIENKNRCYDWAIPAVASNAGNGWIVTLGQLYQPWTEIPDAPSWPNLSNRDFVYISPDGSAHTLACEPEAGACGSVWFSSDLQMRLRKDSATEMQLDFPNGNIHQFKWKSWSGCKLSNVSDQCWLLTAIEDNYNNSVNLSYDENGPGISITDSFGRSHYIDYRLSPADRTEPASYQYVINTVKVNEHASKTLNYDFTYTTPTIDREAPHSFFDSEPLDSTVQVPLLSSISVPESNNYSFEYVKAGPRNSGALDSYQLPTGATVSYAYGDWEFPKPCDFKPHVQGTGGIPHFDDLINFQRSPLRGVVERTITNPWGPDGTTTYRGIAEDRWFGRPGEVGCKRPRWFKTTVEHPSNSDGKWRKEEHYFSVATEDEGDWRRAEYGLPIRKSNSQEFADSGQVFPSEHLYECEATGCTRKRTIFRRYATRHVSTGTFCESGDSPACQRRGSVLVREHITFPDDESTSRGTRWKSYDGLGNFRKIEQYSNGFTGPNDTRHIEQDINEFSKPFISESAESITLNSGFFSALPDLNSRYTLNLYSRRVVHDASFGQRTDYCFNEEGDIIGVRHRASRNSTSNSLAIFYLRNDKGEITAERRSPDSGSLCNTPTKYLELTHTYDDYGRLISSQYSGEDAQELDRSFNTAGHLAQETRPNGVTTTYDTDSLGRPTEIQTGDNAATSISYSTANGTTTPAKAVATQGDLTVTLEVDGLGRPKAQNQTLPDNEELATKLTYDAAGNLIKIAEGQAERSWSYDALGRVTTTTDVAGSRTEFSYRGERIRHRDNEVVTTTYFDAFGREVEVEHGKLRTSGFPEFCVESRFDTRDQPREITRWKGSCGSNSKQTKLFTYDGRGFLTERTTPEVGTVTFEDFDSFGNPGLVSRSESTLELDYTPRGQIASSSSGGMLLTEYEYGGASCDAGNYCLSEVTLARRHNYINGTDYPVEIHPTYNGPSGQETSRAVIASYPKGQHGTVGTSEFSLETSYDSADLPTSLTYPGCPTCLNVPVREISYSHDARKLTQITGAPHDDITAHIAYNKTGVFNGISYEGFSNAYTDFHRRNGLQIDAVVAGSGTQTFWNSGQFRYNDRGRILSIGSDDYTYDSIDRLTSATLRLHDQRSASADFTYDIFDNLLSKTKTIAGSSETISYTPDASSNRLNDFSSLYDNDGNMIEDDCRTYEYDALGMLKTTAAVQDPDGGCSSLATYHYLYDTDNQRILTVCDECEDLGLRINLQVMPEAVAPGDNITITWDAVDGATECEAFDGWSGFRSPSGGSETVQLERDTLFGLRCQVSDGQSVEEVVLGDVLSPEFTFTADSTIANPGGIVTVQWSAVEHANECNASGDWGGAKPVEGGTEEITIDGNKTLILTCSGAGGTTELSVFIEIDFPRPEFQVWLDGQDSGHYLPGEIATFQWSPVTNADDCFLTHSSAGDPNFQPSGFVSLGGGDSQSQPLAEIPIALSGNVRLVCSNAHHEVTKQLSFSVHKGSPRFSFFASPDQFSQEHGLPKLRWGKVWRADECWASSSNWSPGSIHIQGGIHEVDPLQDTLYSMTCRGPYGTTTESTWVKGSAQSIWLPIRPPLDLNAQVDDSPLSVHLAWIRQSEGEDGFKIFRRPIGTADWIEVGSAASGAETFVDDALDYATTYEYAVRAFASGETGPLSNIVEATTPNAPQPPYWLATEGCVIENGCPEVAQQQTFDYGSIVEGDPSGTAHFVIDNTDSSRALEIDIQLSSSDWQITESPHATLPAGARTFLDLNIDRDTPGLKETTVTIHTNDPAKPTLTFTLIKRVREIVGELEFTEDPGFVEVLPGDSAQLSVVVSGGSGDYGYEWGAMSCVVSPCHFAPIEDPGYQGIDTDTLTIPVVSDTHYNHYQVKAWDKQNPETVKPVYSNWGSVSELTISILDGRENQFVREGDDTSLQVEAVGQGNLIYEWWGPSGELVDDWNYAGTGSPKLTIRNAHEALSGEYSATVTNDLNHGRHGSRRLRVEVLPKDVELADMFHGGRDWYEYTPLNRQAFDVGPAEWQASNVVAMELGHLTLSNHFEETKRAAVNLPRSTRNEQIEIVVEVDFISHSDSTDPKIEIGLGNFDSGIEGAYEGIGVILSHDGVLDIVRDGTETLATGNSADCGWHGCLVRFRVNTRLGTAEVLLEDTLEGDYVAAEVDGLTGLDDLKSAFLGFGARPFEPFKRFHRIDSFKVDMDSRPHIAPWLHQLL